MCSLVACKTPSTSVDGTENLQPIAPPTSSDSIADDDPDPSENLIYELTEDGNGYVFAGLGTCTDKEVVIAAVYEELPVVGIKEDAMPSSSKIDSVTKIIVLGSNLTYIQTGAFRGCSSLNEIVLPNTIKTIGSAAFKGCSALASFVFPQSLESLGDGAFYGCSKLVDITLPAAITKIAPQLFYDCSGLETITIAENTTEIGFEAFRSCSKLTAIYTPSQKESITEENKKPDNILATTITSIGERAFMDCVRLEKITIPNAVPVINEEVFYGCSKLSSVTLGNNVTLIDQGAFRYCRALNSINLPNGLSEIKDYAFAGTTKLENLTFNNGLKTIGNYAFHASGLSALELQDTTTYIGEFAFEKCSNLATVKLPATINVINIGAFWLSGVLPEANEGEEAPTSGRQINFSFKGTCDAWKKEVKKFGPFIWGDADSNFKVSCSDGTIDLVLDTEVLPAA